VAKSSASPRFDDRTRALLKGLIVGVAGAIRVAEGRGQMDKLTAIVVGVGAEQGVGGAVCRRFASEGYHVYVAGSTEAKIAKVVGTIAKAGGSAEAVTSDTTKESEVVAL
jgi:short chain dehydrogenase